MVGTLDEITNAKIGYFAVAMFGYGLARAMMLIGLFVVECAIAYVSGAVIFRAPSTEVTFGQVLRTCGFSLSPGVLAITLAPTASSVGILLLFALLFWLIGTFVTALRSAFDFSPAREVGTGITTIAVSVLLFIAMSYGLMLPLLPP
jgi:hypothetical protein